MSPIPRSKPKLLAMQIHPAPYRDPIFKAVHERGRVEIGVRSFFEVDVGHRYRQKAEFAFPHRYLGWGWRPPGGVSFHPGIFAELQRSNCDVLLVPGWRSITAQITIIYAWLTGKPLILTCDQVAFFNPAQGWPSRISDWLFQQLLRHASAVWVPGKASQEFMQEFGVPRERIFQGAYCLDADHLQKVAEVSRNKRNRLRRDLGIKPDDWLFFFVGRMEPWRGLRHLLDAYAQVKRQSLKANLLMVGSGPERDWLEKTSREWQLEGVRFLDPMPMEPLTGYYMASDIYVIASVNETYSLALAQAALCGLPMIATDRVGAADDYVFEGETGLVVPAGNSAALAEAMLRLAASREKAREMGKKARRVALTRNIPWAARQLEAAVFKAIEFNEDRGRRR